MLGTPLFEVRVVEIVGADHEDLSGILKIFLPSVVEVKPAKLLNDDIFGSRDENRPARKESFFNAISEALLVEWVVTKWKTSRKKAIPLTRRMSRRLPVMVSKVI